VVALPRSAGDRRARYSAPGADLSPNDHPGSGGSTGAHPVTLGFGCVNLGSAGAARSMGADIRLVQEAVDLGVRVFDTADVYGSGTSERILGRALRGRRDDVVLATKGGYLFRERSLAEQRARRAVAGAVGRVQSWRRRPGQPGGPGAGGGSYAGRDDSPRHLRAAVEGSLRRLDTDHIDVYQLHGPREVHPTLFGELVDLVTAGKITAFGIGAETVGAAVDWLDVPAVSVVQVPFGVLDPEAVDELLPLLPARPVDVWARGVLGGGLLALAARDPVAAANDPKAPVLGALRDVAARTGLAVDELAVGFVRSFPEVSTVLVGVGSPEHLRRNVALFEGSPLDPAVRAELLAITEAVPGRHDGRS
jgi:aryl-alcohol dehydrogenase-like predicted oxidoreductase